MKVDLLIGSSQDDGLINRAKAVKVGREEPQSPLLAVPQWLRTSKSDLGPESLTYSLIYKIICKTLL